MKHTITSLACLVETLQGQAKHNEAKIAKLEDEIVILKKQHIYVANRMPSNSSAPKTEANHYGFKGYDKLVGAAKEKADSIIAARKARETKRAAAMN